MQVDPTDAGSKAYCTYFDSRYLPRAKAMILSLRSVGEHGPVLALCFDEEAFVEMNSFGKGVLALRLTDLEEAFPQLLSVKEARSTAEYFFTTTPWLVLLTRQHFPDAEWVTYLDADLYFFAPVSDIYDELEPGSCGIIAHNYLPKYQKLEKYGHYNVGWVSFRSNNDGASVLKWWADRCLEWCHDTPEDGRFADQGYLDHFKEVASSVIDIQHPGANVAPWNLGSRSTTYDNETVAIDGNPLLFFHFHGFRRRGARYYASHIEYGAKTTKTTRRYIYEPYVRALDEAEGDSNSHAATGARRGRGFRAWALQQRRNLYDLAARIRGESYPAKVKGSRAVDTKGLKE